MQLTKRLEIMVTPEMANMLRREAKIEKTTVGALVRGAVEEKVKVSSIRERLSALERLYQVKLDLPVSYKEFKRKIGRQEDD